MPRKGYRSLTLPSTRKRYLLQAPKICLVAAMADLSFISQVSVIAIFSLCLVGLLIAVKIRRKPPVQVKAQADPTPRLYELPDGPKSTDRLCTHCQTWVPESKAQYVRYFGGYICDDCSKDPNLWD